MVGKLLQLLASLDIPKHASHVARGCEDTAIIDEATAGEVTGMAGKLSCDAGGAISGREVVNGANVVKTTAGDVVSAGGIGTGHDPRRSQRDGVDLVGSVGVPDDELAILRGRDEMPSVC